MELSYDKTEQQFVTADNNLHKYESAQPHANV